MNPYFYVQQATQNEESLLSLCCGIGLELSGLNTRDITAVDIAPQYLERVSERCPQAVTVCEDSLSYLKKRPEGSVDVISIIDGIEHMDKKTGIKLIKEMKRVAREKILLFTPQGLGEDGFLKNEPHNAWGIEGVDHFQTHKSGWTQEELEGYGFRTIKTADNVSQHDEPYKALMMIWER